MYRNLKCLHMTYFSPHISYVIYVTNIRYGSLVKYVNNQIVDMYKIHVPDKQIHINKLPMCHMPSVESFKSTQLTRVEREREMFILSDFHSSIWVRSTSHLKTEWKLHGQYWSSSCSTRNSSPSSTISYLIQQFIFSATDLQYLLFLNQIY